MRSHGLPEADLIRSGPLADLGRECARSLPHARFELRAAAERLAHALVDAAGLKGARVGDAQVSEKHANFMVNLGHARAADVLTLIRKVRAGVKKASGVTLELELKVVGQA